MDKNTPCIVSAVRTPMGSFLGSLSNLSATDLGAIAIRAAVRRSGFRPEDIQEALIGNVISGNLGQAPSTQAVLGAGLPNSIPATTVNKVCSSGLKSVMLAGQAIRLGQADVILAGGMESMSRAPFYLPQLRRGNRLNNTEIVDGLVKDGLWDPYNNFHMGNCAEACATKHSISREAQDCHAERSHRLAKKAQQEGLFQAEIIPVAVPVSAAAANIHHNSAAIEASAAAESTGAAAPSGFKLVTADEGPGKMDMTKLRKLKPYFKKDGTGSVTAGTSSPMTDGAAALVIASWGAVQAARAAGRRVEVLATLSGAADANQEPLFFTTAPSLAIPKALKTCGLGLKDVDLFELNEAFSVVHVANQKLLGIPEEKINVHGGAVALGHPIGASGARILVTLIHALKQRKGKYGCAAICNGGGGASALVIDAAPVGANGCGTSKL